MDCTHLVWFNYGIGVLAGIALSAIPALLFTRGVLLRYRRKLRELIQESEKQLEALEELLAMARRTPK